MEALDAYRLIAAILGVHGAVTAAEYLAIRREFSPAGLYSWSILGLRRRGESGSPGGRGARLRERLYSYDVTVMSLVVRLVASVMLTGAFFQPQLVVPALALVVGTGLLMSSRGAYGQNGADQMAAIVGLTVLAALLIGTPAALVAGLWFIALQAVLSYEAAGLAKLVSPTWRSGRAAGLIVNCGTYGTRQAAALVAGHAGVSAAASWFVIAFEVLFVVALAGWAPLTLAVLAVGFAFHFATAGIMGLNDFLFAFSAPYPAIWFIASTYGPL